MASTSNFSRIFLLEILSAFILTLTYGHPGHGEGPLPGGSECKDNSVCYSHQCYIGDHCAPDGPVQGTIPGGGGCSTNADCFSNYCLERVCAPDSSVQGKIAGGGNCIQADQCYSGTCINRHCGPDSPVAGKMAAGAECENHRQCYSGFCSYQRCAPDGPADGRAPGGGYCQTDDQCNSRTCFQQQCSPDSLTEFGKVADGGRCHMDTNCQMMSQCVQQICVPKNIGSGQAAPIQTQQGQRYPAGAYCRTNYECETACIFGRCTTPSRFNPMSIADGAPCEQQASMQGQCKSGQCQNHVCTVSYSDRMWLSAAGVPCSNNQLCYSGFCASGKCSSDSPAPLANPAFGHSRNRYQVPGGGLCFEDQDCYSGYCELRSICGADGPKRGTLASGAMCTRDDQCYSQYCFNRRCVAASTSGNGNPQFMTGKSAPGARCARGEACAPGTTCSDTYCKPTDNHGQSVMSNIAYTRPSMGSVRWNGTCWHHAQCMEGQCLEHRCTVAWHLAEKYTSSSVMHAGQIGTLVVSIILIGTRFF